jgi:uncharacterized phage protein (TIGR01671 family)
MNNRVFKFRVWDKQASFFEYYGPHLDPFSGFFAYDGFNLYSDDFQMKRIRVHRNFGNSSQSKINHWFQENYVVQQFTGLLDKNGREIYEGDIFKDYEGEILIVKWGKIQYMGHQGFQFFRLDESEYCFYGSMGNFDEKELVGNIFDNPEMIKVL